VLGLHPTAATAKIISDNAATPVPPSANIIFVHGLGGESKGTWVHEVTKAFWPDWLHDVKGLENARVWTYGYDSDWTKILKISNMGVDAFAIKLSWLLRSDDDKEVITIYARG